MTEPAETPEQRLRRAAFGDAPAIDDRELAAAGRADPRTRLLAAVLLGARGRYAAAATILGELARADDPVTAALAASALAAQRRQLGGHARALALDGTALLRTEAGRVPESVDPDGLDAPGARADALLGLAADNLGLGRPAVARRLVAMAGSGRPGWRASVRSGWVRAEIELVVGQARAAVRHAEPAAELAGNRGAVRHAIKSDLVLAAALGACGSPAKRSRAAGLVDAALAAAEKLELWSLAWPAGLLAAELDEAPAAPHRSRVTRQLHAVLRQADAEGRRLARASPWVPI
ncbi:hypothetical protein [Amycolatopsis cihanbeyliensis]|uniref:Tetratricopeptide repeat protein n=1 Tax=Amycolatopsis cihanbeyliensis TaxID=1128664 RepID=A0A542DJ39_AMYCI|nr:hypothetical protein [Amycolatopsis cihanbeyliensis]TQJ03103.1 hypothetical protein FB471_2853 [Amycolatopsis cihanbeyliensis]